MYCKYCHGLLDDSAVFCNHCGKQVSESSEDEKKDGLQDKPKVNLHKESDFSSETEEQKSDIDKILDEALNNSVSSENQNADNNIPRNIETPPIVARNAEMHEGNPYVAPPQENIKNPRIEPFPDVSDEEISDISEKKISEEKITRVGAGRIIGAGTISILAFVFLLIFSFMISIKLGISGDAIEKRIQKMNTNTVIEMKYNGQPVYKEIYNMVDFKNASGGKTSEYSFKNYLSNTNLLEFAGEKFSGYIDYIMGNQKTDPSVQTEEIVEFFKHNSPVAVDVLKYGMTTSDYNYIRKQLESHNTADDLSMKHLDDSAGFRLRSLSYIFSFITIGIVFILEVVLLMWIALIIDKKGKYVSGFYGNIFFWSGLIVLLAGIGSVAGTSTAYVITSESAFYFSASMLIPFSLFASVTGLFELIIGLILKKIRKFIRVREKREKYAEKQIAKMNTSEE